MALIIGVKRNEDFFVGENRVEVITVHGNDRFFLCIDYPDGSQKKLEVTEESSQEIYPNVLVSAGDTGISGSLARIVIEAPREVEILRGEHKRHYDAEKSPANRYRAERLEETVEQ